MQNLTIWDLVLTPIFLIVLVMLARNRRDKRYPVGHPWRKYYLPGLYLKMGGAVFIGLIYEYYYGGGDTFNYFYHSKVINSAFSDDIGLWFKLLLRQSYDGDPRLYKYISQMYWYGDPAAYTVSAIAAVFGVICATSYMPIALLFAFISYTGIWAMFKTFARIYPTMHRPLAIAFLFIPSTFVWGSALFKDTVCMFALGWMTYSTFRIFIDRDFSPRNLILLVVSFYLLVVIKIYIVLAFMPALGLWLLMSYSKKVKNAVVRWALNLAFAGLVVAGFSYFSSRFAEDLDEYALENIGKKAKKTQDYITQVSEATEGSAYNIGSLDGSIESMLAKFPQAVNVSLYRPYLWEAGKPIILLSALEATAFLILTLMVFYRRGVGGFFKQTFADPNLSFFFIFTIIFAFAVGISTGNFGTLSRYKIPCMPYFGGLLLLMYYQTKTSVSQKPLQHAKKPLHRFA